MSPLEGSSPPPPCRCWPLGAAQFVLDKRRRFPRKVWPLSAVMFPMTVPEPATRLSLDTLPSRKGEQIAPPCLCPASASCVCEGGRGGGHVPNVSFCC